MKQFFYLISMGIFVHISFFYLFNNVSSFVYFLNVSQGDSSIIKNSEGKYYIIDGGPNFEISRYINQFFLFGSCELEGIFISHFHLDHYKGIIRLLEYCSINKIYTSNFSSIPSNLAAALLHSDTEIVVLTSGDSLNFGELSLYVLWPPETYQASDLNDTSLVLLIKSPNYDFIFTGDISGPVQEEALKNFEGDFLIEPSKKLVYKFPHHGSATGLNKKFFSMFSPDITILSYGKDNKFGHPNQEVVDFLSEFNFKYYSTNTSKVFFPL